MHVSTQSRNSQKGNYTSDDGEHHAAWSLVVFEGEAMTKELSNFLQDLLSTRRVPVVTSHCPYLSGLNPDLLWLIDSWLIAIGKYAKQI